MKLSDFWTVPQLKAAPVWRDVYRRVGIGRLLACATFRGNRIGTLNVTRPLRASDFNERDRTMMHLLLPHFLQALHAAEAASSRGETDGRPLPTLGLTKREADVGTWLARGRTNAEIASILAMRPRTVEKHVENILVKLGVENRTTASLLIGGAAFASSVPPTGLSGSLKRTKRARQRPRA